MPSSYAYWFYYWLERCPRASLEELDQWAKESARVQEVRDAE